MLTDLIQINRLGEKKRDENLRLRLHLSGGIIRSGGSFASRGTSRIRSTARPAQTAARCHDKIIDRDVEKLARRLNISRDRFLAEYTREDAEEGRVLKRNEGGCVFLEGTCAVCTTSARTPA